MEKENIYQHAKIYKIISYSHPEIIYFGSTTQQLCRRLQAHKTSFKCGKNTSSSELMKYDDAKIFLIEDYPCENKEQLTKKEGEYIKNNECINKRIAGRTNKEWYNDNKDKIKEHNEVNKITIAERKKKYRTVNKQKISENMKVYYEGNKQHILNKMKVIITCECGKVMRIDNIIRHNKTIKHLEFIKNKII
jgi:hypothetical protein